MSDSRPVELPSNPFPGIEPYSYEHAALLYRRDREKRDLFRRMIMYRGMLLYGDQGVGKSSLVNAGLAPMALAQGFLPHWIRVQPEPDQECVVDPPPPNHGTLDWLAPRRTESDLTRNVTISAADLLGAVRRYESSQRLLLIFDQFEEWITLFGKTPGADPNASAAAQASIRQTIVELLKDPSIAVKVVLSFREDYLAGLEPIFKEVPNLADQYVRLVPLSNNQLRDSILGPFVNFPETYSPGISDNLADKIVTELDEEAPHRRVEAAEVQIVCHNLFEQRDGAEPFEDAYRRLDGAKGILANYFESKLDSIPVTQREAAVALLARLVQGDHRNVVSQDNLLQLVQLDEGLDRDMVETALSVLVDDAKLVKRQNREGVEYIEITSEFLIDWIHKARRDQLDVHHQRELDDQKQAFVDRQARWTRWVGAAVLVLVPLLAFVFFQLGSSTSDEPPRAEIESISIQGFEDLNTDLLFDDDEQEPLVIPSVEGGQIKIEVKFKREYDIVDVNVVPASDGAEPIRVYRKHQDRGTNPGTDSDRWAGCVRTNGFAGSSGAVPRARSGSTNRRAQILETGVGDIMRFRMSVIAAVLLVLAAGCEPTGSTGTSGATLPPETTSGYGATTLDALAAACETDGLAACDELWELAPVGSDLERLGASCGNRFPIGDEVLFGDCVGRGTSPTTRAGTGDTSSTIVRPQTEVEVDPKFNTWTVILRSIEEDKGIDEAIEYARQLREVGVDAAVFLSSQYPSLNPGYWVVYIGEFGDPDPATALCDELKGRDLDCYHRFVGNS